MSGNNRPLVYSLVSYLYNDLCVDAHCYMFLQGFLVTVTCREYIGRLLRSKLIPRDSLLHRYASVTLCSSVNDCLVFRAKRILVRFGYLAPKALITKGRPIQSFSLPNFGAYDKVNVSRQLFCFVLRCLMPIRVACVSFPRHRCPYEFCGINGILHLSCPEQEDGTSSVCFR